MTKLIAPTVGRKIYYRPYPNERSSDHAQPFDASIAHVIDDDTIVISVVNDIGYPMTPKTVTLAHGREARYGECYWMDYQIGQAKHHYAAAPPAADPPAAA